MARITIATGFAFLLLAASAVSQVNQAQTTLLWTGSSGTSAGSICGGLSCTPDNVSVTGGEMVTLDFRGKFQGGYFLGFAATATSCVSIPGALSGLALDPPITLLLAGTLNQADTLGECPGGIAIVTVQMPASLPSGVNFAVQALNEVAATPGLTFFGFSTPIRVTTV